MITEMITITLIISHLNNDQYCYSGCWY